MEKYETQLLVKAAVARFKTAAVKLPRVRAVPPSPKTKLFPARLQASPPPATKSPPPVADVTPPPVADVTPPLVTERGPGWLQRTRNAINNNPVRSTAAATTALAATPTLYGAGNSLTPPAVKPPATAPTVDPRVPEPDELSTQLAGSPQAGFDWLKRNWKTVGAGAGTGLAAILAWHLWNKRNKEEEEENGLPVKFAGLDMRRAVDNEFVLGFLTQCARDRCDEAVTAVKIAAACQLAGQVAAEFEKCAAMMELGPTVPRGYNPPKPPTTPPKPQMPSGKLNLAAPSANPETAKNLATLRQQRTPPPVQAIPQPDNPYWANHSPAGEWTGQSTREWPTAMDHISTGPGFPQQWADYMAALPSASQQQFAQLSQQSGLDPATLGRADIAKKYLRAQLPTLNNETYQQAYDQWHAVPVEQRVGSEPVRPDIRDQYNAFYSMPPEYQDALQQLQAHQISQYRSKSDFKPGYASQLPGIGARQDAPGEWMWPATPDKAHEQFDQYGNPRLLDPTDYVNLPELASRYNVDMRSQDFLDYWQQQKQRMETALQKQTAEGRGPVDHQYYRTQHYRDPHTLMANYWRDRDQRQGNAWNADMSQNRTRDQAFGFRREDPRTGEEIFTTEDRLGDQKGGLWDAVGNSMLGVVTLPFTLANPDSRAMATRSVWSLPNYVWGTDLGHQLKPDAAAPYMGKGQQWSHIDRGQDMTTTPTLFGEGIYDPVQGAYKPSASEAVSRGYAYEADNPENSPQYRVYASGLKDVAAKGDDMATYLALNALTRGGLHKATGGGMMGGLRGPAATRIGINQIDPFNRERPADGKFNWQSRGMQAYDDLAQSVALPWQVNPLYSMAQQASDEIPLTRYMFNQLPAAIRANTTFNPNSSTAGAIAGETLATGLQIQPWLAGDLLTGQGGKLLQNVGDGMRAKSLSGAGQYLDEMGRLTKIDPPLAGAGDFLSNLTARATMSPTELQQHGDDLLATARKPWKDVLRGRVQDAAETSVTETWNRGLQVDPDRMDHFLKQQPEGVRSAYQAFNNMNAQQRGLIVQLTDNGIPFDQAIDRVTDMDVQQLQRVLGTGPQPATGAEDISTAIQPLADNSRLSQVRTQLPPAVQQALNQYEQELTTAMGNQYATQGYSPEQYTPVVEKQVAKMLNEKIWLEAHRGREKQNAWQQRLRLKVAERMFSDLPKIDAPLTAPPPQQAPSTGGVPKPPVPAPVATQPQPQQPGNPTTPMTQPLKPASPAPTPQPQPSVPVQPGMAPQPQQSAQGTPRPGNPVPPTVATDGSAPAPVSPSPTTPPAASPAGPPSLKDATPGQWAAAVFDPLTGGAVSQIMQAAPAVQAKIRGQIEQVVQGNEVLAGVTEQLAAGKNPLSPQAVDQVALEKVTAQLGDPQAAQSAIGNMDFMQKVLLWGGLGLGSVGLISAMTAENGGIMPWLLTALGLGGAAFGAANAGLLGQDAQQFTQPIRQGGDDLATGISDAYNNEPSPRLPAFMASGLAHVPDVSIGPMLAGLTKLKPELARRLDQAIGHGSWGNSVLSFAGDLTGRTNQAFIDAGIPEDQIPRIMEGWRRYRSQAAR